MMDRTQRGFTLLEMACTLGVVALMAAVLLPSIPRQTSRARLQAYAVEIAAILKADRNAAISRGTSVATLVDAAGRVVISGTSGARIKVANDVGLDTVLAKTCAQRAVVATIEFFASGSSCGGAITLTRQNFTCEIQVNWLTGRVEIDCPAIN